jgi:hypothetical protein
MKRLFFFLLLSCATAQSNLPEKSSGTPSGRYEIVGSPLVSALTFKLDKFSGRIWQLVVNKEGVHGWDLIPVVGLSNVTDGEPIEPDLDTFPGTWQEYRAALTRFRTQYRDWVAAEASRGVRSTARFQIFMSGIKAANSFLIDCSNGDVWLFTSHNDGKTGQWQPMPDNRR